MSGRGEQRNLIAYKEGQQRNTVGVVVTWNCGASFYLQKPRFKMNGPTRPSDSCCQERKSYENENDTLGEGWRNLR